MTSQGSLYRGSAPGTAHKDVARCVHVPVMGRAAAARPSALIQSRTTFRPGDHAAYVAGLGTPRLIHFLERRAIPNGLVREHVSKGAPSGIADGFSHCGFLQCGGVDIADRDVIELSDDARRELVQEVAPGIANARMDVCCLALLVGALGLCERLLKLAEVARVADHLAGAQGREVFQPQVDADATDWRARGGIGRLNDDIQEPVSTRIAREVRAVLDLHAGRKVTTLEYSEFSPMEVKSFWCFLHVAALDRHPSKGAFAAIAQIWASMLPSRSLVLCADSLNGAGVETKLFTAAGGQLVEVVSAGPLLSPFERVLLRVVAEIEDVIDGARLLVQQSGQAFNAVSIRENHRPILSRKGSVMTTPSAQEAGK